MIQPRSVTTNAKRTDKVPRQYILFIRQDQAGQEMNKFQQIEHVR